MIRDIFYGPPDIYTHLSPSLYDSDSQVSPSFYSVNLLFIAKCYVRMKQEVKAEDYFERVVHFAPVRSEEDADAVKEAQRMLLIDD